VRLGADGALQVDVYLVTDLMEADLEQIIKSPQALSDEHVRYLSQQMLSGLRHLHQHGVVHRDLKPSNLVVDSFCRLKVCDLGLSRHIRDGAAVGAGEDALFTDYVVTRWYRAPELLLGSRRYSLAVDIWAAGCIVAELLARRPLFAGDDPSDMLLRIAAAVGRPSPAEAAALERQPGVSAGARAFARGLAQRPDAPPGRRLEDALPPGAAGGGAAALVRALLRWDAAARLGAEAALTHPFLAPLYEPPPAPAAAAAHAPPPGEGAERSLPLLAESILREAALWRR
jgi:serine/threonine protein kinase